MVLNGQEIIGRIIDNLNVVKITAEFLGEIGARGRVFNVKEYPFGGVTEANLE